jgi:septal ring factor EnvC (AmiA/AmiB activator)
MDWVSIVVTLATGMFLVPIINDFQKRSLALSRRISDVEAQVQRMMASNEKEKEEERSVAAELAEAEKELAEVERERDALQRAIQAKTKKKR